MNDVVCNYAISDAEPHHIDEAKGFCFLAHVDNEIFENGYKWMRLRLP
jgi:hypothetical protein